MTVLPGLTTDSPVIIRQSGYSLTISLNRPQTINSLNLEMVRLLQAALEIAKKEAQIHFILLRGEGERGFCAGGDLKTLAQAVQAGEAWRADQFFREEYALDLAIHEFPKPVVVLADGVTMGGGLGLAAGADLVIATERTHIALPETRIGFFPDVGATGWLFTKCPPGYPEFLALTGYEIQGTECLRLGLATDFTRSSRLPLIHKVLTNFAVPLPGNRQAAAALLHAELSPFLEQIKAGPCDLDQWVAHHFQGKKTLPDIIGSLSTCSLENLVCREVFAHLAERSPSALALTLMLLRHNEGKPLLQVFAAEAQAAAFIIRHPDYLEGIRARLLDKDDRPQWSPATIDALEPLALEL
jgi:enoyl-CoA hydratase/carnithine racemase